MKKHSKLILAAVLALTLLMLPAYAGVVYDEIPASLPEGTLIYSEDFENASGSDTDAVLDSIGWVKCEDFKEFTAVVSVVDGRLRVDNLESTVGTSNDSYAMIMDSDYLKQFCSGDYTYQYEATYLDAGNSYRYLSLLCNYDGMNNYNTVDVRMRGDGYNQVRRGDSSWIHYNDTVCPMRAADDTSMLKQLFGLDYDENAYAMQNRTFTVRVEMSVENGPAVYVNGLLVSEMAENTENWGDIDAYAICYKTSTFLLSEIDNIMVWSGLTDAPIIPAEPEPEPEPEPVAEAPAAEAEVAVTAPVSAAQTFDALAIAAAALAISGIAAGIAGKKRK